jgi:hypothetical protein
MWVDGCRRVSVCLPVERCVLGIRNMEKRKDADVEEGRLVRKREGRKRR